MLLESANEKIAARKNSTAAQELNKPGDKVTKLADEATGLKDENAALCPTMASVDLALRSIRLDGKSDTAKILLATSRAQWMGTTKPTPSDTMYLIA
jgi:hypothetical protein